MPTAGTGQDEGIMSQDTTKQVAWLGAETDSRRGLGRRLQYLKPFDFLLQLQKLAVPPGNL